MPNYQNGKIYSIRNYNDETLIYVGSTTQKLCQRMTCHRNEYLHKPTYKCAKQVFDAGVKECYIELIKLFPCSSKAELHREEGKFIRQMNCVNKTIPGRTRKEYREDNKDYYKKYGIEYRKKNKERKKEYYMNNKEVIKKRTKEWYEKTKEKFKKSRKEYREKNKEMQSKLHKEWYEKNKEKISKQRRENACCPHCNKQMRKTSINTHIKNACKKAPK